MTDSQLLKNAHAVKACLKAHASSLPCKYDTGIHCIQTCDDQFIYIGEVGTLSSSSLMELYREPFVLCFAERNCVI